MTRKPLHQTSSGASGPLINVLFAGKPCCLTTPDLHRIAGTMAEASRLPDTPVFHHTTGLTGNTQAGSARSTAMTPVFGRGRLLSASMRLQGNGQRSGRWNRAGVAAMVGWLHAHIPPWRLPPLLMCRPAFGRVDGVWWGRGREVSALLGMSLDWHVSSLLPLCRAGGGGLIRRPAALTRAKRVIVGVFPSDGGGRRGPRPCRSCPWPGRAGCPPRLPWGARLLAGTCT